MEPLRSRIRCNKSDGPDEMARGLRNARVFRSHGSDALYQGTTSVVPHKTTMTRALAKALAPEARFSIIPHAQSLGNGGKKQYLRG
jgi:hypothetical protein